MPGVANYTSFGVAFYEALEEIAMYQQN